ncbi:VPS4-associated protein 1 [Thermoascus aurantiacus ATCC 26904]
MSLPNVWHLRRVADTSAKACFVCYKPSTSVLITPDNRDFFYICPIHLKDRGFCSPIVDSEKEAAKKKEEALAREIERVKQEYEEKQRKKKEKEEKEKEKEKGEGSKGKEDKDTTKAGGKGDDAQHTEKEKNDKIDSIKKAAAESKPDDSPRIFALHKTFYQMRIDRIRNMEIAKRNRERLKDPSFFPKVPTGDL